MKLNAPSVEMCIFRSKLRAIAQFAVSQSAAISSAKMMIVHANRRKIVDVLAHQPSPKAT